MRTVDQRDEDAAAVQKAAIARDAAIASAAQQIERLARVAAQWLERRKG